MKNGRYSDAQIMAVLKQAEGGVPVSELCREHGMSSASFTNGGPSLAEWMLGLGVRTNSWTILEIVHVQLRRTTARG